MGKKPHTEMWKAYEHCSDDGPRNVCEVRFFGDIVSWATL